jgi:hypothetical protein
MTRRNQMMLRITPKEEDDKLFLPVAHKNMEEDKDKVCFNSSDNTIMILS